LTPVDDGIVVEEAILPNNTRELNLGDLHLSRLRELLLAGAESALGPTANAAYFDGLRKHVKSGRRVQEEVPAVRLRRRQT
jgi:hypothetical protein